MSDNPYAPPEADVTPVPSGSTAVGGTGDFSIGQSFSDAWAAMWAGFPLWLGFGVVASIAFGLSAMTVIGLFLAWPGLVYGATLFLLRLHDGDAALGDLWEGFRTYTPTTLNGLGLGLLLVLLTYVGQIPVLVATVVDSTGALVVAQFVNFVWAFVLVRFYFALFLWVDQGFGPTEALQGSWRMTGPVFWKMVGLMFLLSALMLPGILAALVTVLPAVATDTAGFGVVAAVGGILAVVLVSAASVLGYLMFASAYRQVAGRPGGGH